MSIEQAVARDLVAILFVTFLFGGGILWLIVATVAENWRKTRVGERNALLKQAMVEPWPEPVDGAALLDELSGLVSRFVVLPKRAADALALWMVHTYAFELGDVTAYIGVESPEKRCGKSTLLTLLSRLVNRPVVASAPT